MFHVCLFSLWVLGGSREWWSWEHLLSLLLFLRSMECLYGINILFTHQHASVLYRLFATPCQFPSWFTWQMTKQNVVQRKNPTQIQPEYAWIVFCSHHIIYRFRGTNVSVGKNICLYLYNISKSVKIGTMKWRNTNIQYLLGVVDLTTYKSTSIKETRMFIVSLSVCTTSSFNKNLVFLNDAPPWCPSSPVSAITLARPARHRLRIALKLLSPALWLRPESEYAVAAYLPDIVGSQILYPSFYNG